MSGHPHAGIERWIAAERRAARITAALAATWSTLACLAVIGLGDIGWYMCLAIPIAHTKGAPLSLLIVIPTILVALWMVVGMAWVIRWRRTQRDAKLAASVLEWWEEVPAGHPAAGVVLAGGHVLVRFAVLPGRLLLEALAAFRRAAWPPHVDVAICAPVLAQLRDSPRRVPWADVVAAHPGARLDALLPQLRQLPGVLMLEGDPVDLWLTDPTRAALGGVAREPADGG